MDFDAKLTSVSCSLMHAQTPGCIKLCDISRENTDDINRVFEVLRPKLSCCSEGELRKINLLLIMNTEFSCAHVLKQDDNYCHLTGAFPQLSTYLYFKLIDRFKMHTFFKEVIISSPEVLAVDIMKNVSHNWKGANVEIAIDLMTNIIDGLFQKIYKLHVEESLENIQQVFVKILQTFLDINILEILENCDWEIERKQCFFGRYIHKMLLLLEKFVKIFNRVESVDRSNPLYSVKVDFDYKQWPCGGISQDWSVYAMQIMIRKCEKCIKDVTVDIFIAWCEEDFSAGVTLQLAVKETAYFCIQALETLSYLAESITNLKSLISTLQNISQKPLSEEEQIRNADVDLIIKNVHDTSKNQLKWLTAYLSNEKVISNGIPSNVLNDLKKLKNNNFDINSCLNLIQVAVDMLKAKRIPSDQAEGLKEIVLNIVKQLSFKEQLAVLNQNIVNGYSDILKKDGFNKIMTEAFNKMTVDMDLINKMYTVIVGLLLQSPKEVILDILERCLENKSHCDTLKQLLTDFEVIHKIPSEESDLPYLFSCIVKKFSNCLKMSFEKRINLMYLIKSFSMCDLIDKKEFIFKYLIPAIEASFANKKWEKLDCQLDILSVFIDPSGESMLVGKEVEILAFLAHLLDRSRMQPPQFTVHNAGICEKLCSYTFNLSRSLAKQKSNKEDRDLEWLREVGARCSPLTWFHLRKLWPDGGLPADPDNMLVWTQQDLGIQDFEAFPHDKRARFVTSLCKLLPLLTGGEWRMIGYNLTGASRAKAALSVTHILLDALLVLVQLPVILNNTQCLSNILSNFIGFMQFKTMGAVKHSKAEDAALLTEKLLVLLTTLPAAVIESREAALVMVLEPLLSIVAAHSEVARSRVLDLAPSLHNSTLNHLICHRITSKVSG